MLFYATINRFPWDFSPSEQPNKLETNICPSANIIVSIKNNIFYFLLKMNWLL